MKIGALAKNSDFSTETIRYYEKQGLISAASRLANGYRNYSKQSLAQLRFINHAKNVGFTLVEIRQLLNIQEVKDQHTCGEVKKFTGQKLAEIERKLAELNTMHTALQKIYDKCCGGTENAIHCSILTELEKIA